MDLFRVECHGMYESIRVYVAAETATEAQGRALKAMRDFKWKHNDWAGTVEVIATEGPYNGEVFVY